MSNLTGIFCAVVRPILEYGCQVWHFSFTEKLPKSSKSKEELLKPSY